MNYDVIIPCFNAAPFLRDTIASVRAQTHPPQRIIAVDDGSTDETLAVLKDVLPNRDVIVQANKGPGAATMTGVKASTASTLAFIDADDLWFSNKIDVQRKTLAAASVPTAVFCRMEAFNDGPDQLAVDASVAGWSRSTLVVARSTFDAVGPIRDTGNHTGEMVDWFARAEEADVSLVMIEKLLARRRLHKGSLTRRTEDTAEGYLAAAKAAILRKRQSRND